MLDTSQLPLTGPGLQHFRAGLAFASTKEYAKALDCYNNVLKITPDCPQVWHERGLMLENLGAYREAIASYDQALKLRSVAPVADEVWHSRGNALQYGLGQYEVAIRCYDRALQLKPDNAQVWSDRANALLYGLRRCEEAIANYDRALGMNPAHALSWRHRGNALLEMGRYRSAITSFDHALALDPQDELAVHGRSQALSQVGLDPLSLQTNAAWYGRGFSEYNPIDGQLLEAEEETEAYDSQMNSATPSTPAVSSPVLQPALIVEIAEARWQVSLTKPLYIVGRDPKSDIYLQSSFVSRHHATLLQLPPVSGTSCYQILDGSLKGKRSTNGLLINGAKQTTWNLQHEDVIAFGPDVQATYLEAAISILQL